MNPVATQTESAAQAAFNQVCSQIAIPVFLNRLEKGYGIKAANDQEVQTLIDMGRKLYDNQQRQKQAQAASGSWVQYAAAHLDHDLQGAHAGGQVAVDQAIKSAAAAQAKRPEIAQAVLTLLTSAKS